MSRRIRAVSASGRVILPILLQNSRHRGVPPVRVLHEQLCSLGTCPTGSRNRICRVPLRLFQTVIVVVLLAMDFWNCRVRDSRARGPTIALTSIQNVSGRTLVGLRYWNQVRPSVRVEGTSS